MPGNEKNRQKSERPDLFSTLENQLQSSLAPVPPNPEFVQDLRNRLNRSPGMLLERESRLLDTLIAFGIITGGMLVLVGIIRAIFEILVAVGIIQLDE